MNTQAMRDMMMTRMMTKMKNEEEFANEERILSKKDVFKSYLIYWFTAEICHSFERMQAPGFCAALVPALKKFYPNKEDKTTLY